MTDVWRRIGVLLFALGVLLAAPLALAGGMSPGAPAGCHEDTSHGAHHGKNEPDAGAGACVLHCLAAGLPPDLPAAPVPALHRGSIAVSDTGPAGLRPAPPERPPNA